MDTLKVTLQNINSDALKSTKKSTKNAPRWIINSDEDGTVNSQYIVIPLNKAEQNEAYNGTVVLSYDYKNKFLNCGVSSVPVMLYGTSLKRVQVSDLASIADVINEQVAPYTHITLDDALVTRIDNDTLLLMEQGSGTTIAFLDAITRSKQFRYNKTYFQSETLQFRNNTRTVSLYDKYGKNIKNEKEREQMHRLPDAQGRSNLLRYEVQNKCARAIRQVTGQNITLKDVSSEQVQMQMVEQRKKEFDKLFKFDDDAMQVERTINTFNYMKTVSSKTAFNDTILLYAMQQGLAPELLEQMLKLGGVSRQAIHKRKKQINALLSQDIPNRELFYELKTKIHNDGI